MCYVCAGLPTLCETCPEKSLLQLFNALLISIDSIFTAVAVREEGGREEKEGRREGESEEGEGRGVKEGGRDRREGRREGRKEGRGWRFFTCYLCEQDTTGSSMSVSHYGRVPVEGEDPPISSV